MDKIEIVKLLLGFVGADTEKDKALADAWSVPKIADEMGVSDQTIYNKMKKLEAEA